MPTVVSAFVRAVVIFDAQNELSPCFGAWTRCLASLAERDGRHHYTETVAPEIVLYCVMQMRTPLIAEAMQASSSVLTKHEFVKHFLTCATMTMPSCMLHPLTHLFSIVFILLAMCFHCTRDPKAVQGNLDTSYAFCVKANIGGCIPSWSLSKCANSARHGRTFLSRLALLEYYKFVPTLPNQYIAFSKVSLSIWIYWKKLQPEGFPFFQLGVVLLVTLWKSEMTPESDLQRVRPELCYCLTLVKLYFCAEFRIMQMNLFSLFLFAFTCMVHLVLCLLSVCHVRLFALNHKHCGDQRSLKLSFSFVC